MNRPAPASIQNIRLQHVLRLQWREDETQLIAHVRLRGACPCAKCRVLRLAGKIMLVNEDVELVGVNNMGYGIQLVFSDGHDRGIYPWIYLYELGAQP